MTQRNRFIDVAKGIAIILVIFNHYEWTKTSVFNTHLYHFVINMAVPVFMLCTGYVTAVSFEAKNITLKDAYTKKSLLPKLSRYVMPFVWYYALETILTLVFVNNGYLQYIYNLDFAYNAGYSKTPTFIGTIVFFFAGGRGQHGTYYFPVIIQVAFMIPLIYKVVKKHKYGIYVCFLVNLALEILKNFIGILIVNPKIPHGAYRLLAFRYIFVIALGCYMYIYREKIGKWYKWAALSAVGAGYIYLINYTSYERVIFTYWAGTSMLAVLFVAPLFLLCINKLKNTKCAFLENIGKASYHILFAQILYFNFFAPLVWTAPKSIIPNQYVGFVVSLAVCLITGYGYYLLYNKLSLMYKKYKNKKVPS